MRDNWMDLAEYAVGDEQFSVTHDLLVDRLRFLAQQHSRRRPSDPGPSRVRGSGFDQFSSRHTHHGRRQDRYVHLGKFPFTTLTTSTSWTCSLENS